MALLHALFAWIYVRFLRHLMDGMLLGFPALWVLFEWLRSWFLTGFPWLYIGYSTLDTWAQGWVPVIGVFGVSLLCAFSASCIYLAYMRRHVQAYLVYATMIASIWLIGWQLQQAKWVAPASATPLSVGIVQPNIPQELKWQREYYEPTLALFQSMTEPLLGRDIILWPESAIPNYYQRSGEFLLPLANKAREQGSARIRVALNKLSPEQRAVVELTFYDECSYREIAVIVGCPENTVKTRMFHARRRLKRLLGTPEFGIVPQRRDHDAP